MARPSGRDIRQAAVDTATEAIKSSGVTGFSYADLAQQIGVRAPSIHHHFRRKDDLLTEAAAQYRATFRARVDALEGRGLDRLRGYGELFLEPADDELLCLCGAAVAGWDDLEEATRVEITSFFDDEIDWVETQLRYARDDGELRAEADVGHLALTFVAGLEGALLLARARGDRAQAAAAALTVLDLVAT